MDYGQIKEFELAVKNPPKTCVVRLPSAEEWLARMAAQKSLRTDLGRRKVLSRFVPNPEADLALLKAIKVSGDDLDAFEAEHFIGLLARAEVVESEPSGAGYMITVEWRLPGMKGRTRHRMRGLTMAEVFQYRRSVVSVIDLPHGQTEIHYNLRAAVELYDGAVVEADGYADRFEVPPIHKGPVASELVQLVDDGGDDADF